MLGLRLEMTALRGMGHVAVLVVVEPEADWLLALLCTHCSWVEPVNVALASTSSTPSPACHQTVMTSPVLIAPVCARFAVGAAAFGVGTESLVPVPSPLIVTL